MVFPSVPVYLDPPNWNQVSCLLFSSNTFHLQKSWRNNSGGGASQLPPGVAAPRPEGGLSATIRPGSMVDRARIAKIPQPEPGLKCPRCDSSNTKFCYFNNYSLSQPRHFCKACRRYWTRGGAIRNVPVGGGCRRNKRTKSAGGSASRSSTTNTQTGAASSSSTATSSGVGGAITSNALLPPQLPFMASLHPLPDFGATNFGMSFSGIQPMDTLDYQLGGGSGSGAPGGSAIGMENLRLPQMQQFSSLRGLDLPQPPAPAPASGLFPFLGEGSGVSSCSDCNALSLILQQQILSSKEESMRSETTKSEKDGREEENQQTRGEERCEGGRNGQKLHGLPICLREVHASGNLASLRFPRDQGRPPSFLALQRIKVV
ncbi:hypothetical protein BHM03_00000045 [Ensete ventricosum]|uniref:Dof zinc finger protein n=1 Tax=Ensete ventricosum TaxID=4639 RepID=A0A445M868_ENSVE|nr:hypothetical protein BHM03_00000045 [Ensete ventricosum]